MELLHDLKELARPNQPKEKLVVTIGAFDGVHVAHRALIAGAVMRAEVVYDAFGLDTKVPYAISITVADLIMTDGKRLEKIGVAPDEKLFPTALDLANKRDPVLARAAEILGFKLTSEQAGAIFDKKKQ